MKIACPKCGTRFTVPDQALGAKGRTLRCARCANTWHQMPTAPATDASLDTIPDADRTVVSAGDHAPLAEHLETPDTPPPQGRGRTFLDDPLADPLPMDSDPPGHGRSPGEDAGADELPDFDDILARLEDQERERAGRRDSRDDPASFGDDDDLPGVLRDGPGGGRNRARGRRRPPAWASLGMAALLVLAGTLGGLYFLRDSVVERVPATERIYRSLGITLSRPGLGLRLEKVIPTRELVDGEDILVVRGFIKNTSETQRPVPALQLMLNDANGEMVQRMVAPPPTTTLAAGESTDFRMTLRNQLPGAEAIEVTFTDRPPEPMVTPPGQGQTGPGATDGS